MFDEKLKTILGVMAVLIVIISIGIAIVTAQEDSIICEEHAEENIEGDEFSCSRVFGSCECSIKVCSNGFCQKENIKFLNPVSEDG